MPRSELDPGGKAFKAVALFWEEITAGKRKLSTPDWEHIRNCNACQEHVLQLMADRKLKVSSKMMAAIKHSEFGEKVIRTICLNAVGSSVFN